VTHLPERSVLRDRIHGMMLGAAIGDALGSAFEMMPSAEIYRRCGAIVKQYHPGMPGSLLRGRAAGIPTDTAMALSLAKAIAERPVVTAASIAARFGDDLSRDGAFGPMFLDGAPGNACMSMLYALDRGSAPFKDINPNAGGNGAAMRAHPCAVLPSAEAAARVAALQARLSHPHSAAVASAEVVALIAHIGLYHGYLCADFPKSIRDERMCASWSHFHEVDDALNDPSEPLPARLRDVDMAGWNTVAAAHAIAQLFQHDFAGGVGAAAASGRDTDTVANIVGGMLGAVHGRRALPAHLLDGLAYREQIESVANVLADAAERMLDQKEHS
jgi:ADP-ribosyl-[dinitrogen reductase] hydrolase